MREAGGVVRRLGDGGEFTPCSADKQRLICGNAALVENIMKQQDRNPLPVKRKMSSDSTR